MGRLPQTAGTVVIGAGQAGLAMSYWLTRLQQQHVILERGRIAERWRSERWDSLRFQFPNWGVELPGFPYSGHAPEGFAGHTEIAQFIEAYARHIKAPVHEVVAVRRLRKSVGGFMVDTDSGAIFSRNVVVATGPYQLPRIPPLSAGLKDIVQLHTSAYRNPAQLPEGGVLIVGAGASGAQIAGELAAATRQVWLAVGAHRRVPRRYRGHDFHHWEFELGEWDRPTAQRRTDEPPPLLTGIGGGHDLDLRDLAAAGVMLTGRLTGITEGVASFAPDLAVSLAAGDAFYDRFVTAVDAHARAKGLPLPPAEPRSPHAALSAAQPLAHLDLTAAGIGCVIWATGYTLDFGWIDIPGFTPATPAHDQGVSSIAGLYFLGLPWLAKRKSTLLAGVGEDAERLARHIAARTPPSDLE